MESKKLVKETLDYLFINNGSPDSYFNSKEVDSYFINNSNVVLAAAAAVMDKTLKINNLFDKRTTNVLTTFGKLLNDNNSISIDDNFTLYNNGSDLINNQNNTDIDTTAEDITELIRMVATSIVLGLMILITIIGNVFVIAAIILERNLQNVANYLVASLAVADLFVACLVMPLGAVYEISQGWILGPELCDIWTSCDVLCCTASILHLVAIATDRYWAVTNIDYIHSRTSKRVFLMIFLVWFAAVIVSLAPQFGWKDPDYMQRIEQQKCMVSQDVGYQVFATCCTFYVPLLVILVLYWKIYQTARKRIHRRRPRPLDVATSNNQPHIKQKKRRRLRLRIGKFSSDNGKSSSGLVQGNSTNTVNTVEDTEFSSSNLDNKSRTGIEVTTIFNNPNEISSTTQIATVSHLVAIANQQQQQQQQQQQTTTKNQHNQISHNSYQQNEQQKKENQIKFQNLNETISVVNNNINSSKIDDVINITNATTKIISNDNENNENFIDDHQLKQQKQQQNENENKNEENFQQIKCNNDNYIVDNSCNINSSCVVIASTATTITSISTLSPQTPINSTIPDGNITIMTANSSITNISASNQVTPLPQIKHQHYQQNLSSIPNPQTKVTKRKETLEAKRERKAAKTLAIITGAFVVCWLPFFLMALLLPLCETCNLNDTIASFFLWLGYFNSTLNPVIYTVFSPEFRQAFKRILFGGHHPVHYRSGKI